MSKATLLPRLLLLLAATQILRSHAAVDIASEFQAARKIGDKVFVDHQVTFRCTQENLGPGSTIIKDDAGNDAYKVVMDCQPQTRTYRTHLRSFVPALMLYRAVRVCDAASPDITAQWTVSSLDPTRTSPAYPQAAALHDNRKPELESASVTVWETEPSDAGTCPRRRIDTLWSQAGSTEGAAYGSVVPGFGTVVGGVIGGLVGGGESEVMKKLDALEKKEVRNAQTIKSALTKITGITRSLNNETGLLNTRVNKLSTMVGINHQLALQAIDAAQAAGELAVKYSETANARFAEVQSEFEATNNVTTGIEKEMFTFMQQTGSEFEGIHQLFHDLVIDQTATKMDTFARFMQRHKLASLTRLFFLESSQPSFVDTIDFVIDDGAAPPLDANINNTTRTIDESVVIVELAVQGTIAYPNGTRFATQTSVRIRADSSWYLYKMPPGLSARSIIAYIGGLNALGGECDTSTPGSLNGTEPAWSCQLIVEETTTSCELKPGGAHFPHGWHDSDDIVDLDAETQNGQVAPSTCVTGTVQTDWPFGGYIVNDYQTTKASLDSTLASICTSSAWGAGVWEVYDPDGAEGTSAGAADTTSGDPAHVRMVSVEGLHAQDFFINSSFADACNFDINSWYTLTEAQREQSMSRAFYTFVTLMFASHQAVMNEEVRAKVEGVLPSGVRTNTLPFLRLPDHDKTLRNCVEIEHAKLGKVTGDAYHDILPVYDWVEEHVRTTLSTVTITHLATNTSSTHALGTLNAGSTAVPAPGIANSTVLLAVRTTESSAAQNLHPKGHVIGRPSHWTQWGAFYDVNAEQMSVATNVADQVGKATYTSVPAAGEYETASYSTVTLRKWYDAFSHMPYAPGDAGLSPAYYKVAYGPNQAPVSFALNGTKTSNIPVPHNLGQYLATASCEDYGADNVRCHDTTSEWATFVTVNLPSGQIVTEIDTGCDEARTTVQVMNVTSGGVARVNVTSYSKHTDRSYTMCLVRLGGSSSTSPSSLCTAATTTTFSVTGGGFSLLDVAVAPDTDACPHSYARVYTTGDDGLCPTPSAIATSATKCNDVVLTSLAVSYGGDSGVGGGASGDQARAYTDDSVQRVLTDAATQAAESSVAVYEAYLAGIRGLYDSQAQANDTALSDALQASSDHLSHLITNSSTSNALSQKQIDDYKRRIAEATNATVLAALDAQYQNASIQNAALSRRLDALEATTDANISEAARTINELNITELKELYDAFHVARLNSGGGGLSIGDFVSGLGEAAKGAVGVAGDALDLAKDAAKDVAGIPKSLLDGIGGALGSLLKNLVFIVVLLGIGYALFVFVTSRRSGEHPYEILHRHAAAVTGTQARRG